MGEYRIAKGGLTIGKWKGRSCSAGLKSESEEWERERCLFGVIERAYGKQLKGQDDDQFQRKL